MTKAKNSNDKEFHYEYPLTPDLVLTRAFSLANSLKIYHNSDNDCSGEEILENIKSYITLNENTIFYFDKRLTLTEPNSAKIVWIDTNLKDSIGSPILISLIREYQGAPFKGHFWGNSSKLMLHLKNTNPGIANVISSNYVAFLTKYPKYKCVKIGFINQDISQNTQIKSEQCSLEGNIEEKEVKYDTDNNFSADDIFARHIHICEKCTREITENIYENLLYQNWKSPLGLEKYIKIIGDRILALKEKNNFEYFLKNKEESIIINTGLLNKYGMEIKIMYKYYAKWNSYNPHKIMNSKNDYVLNGFTKEQISTTLKPISFFDSQNYLSISEDEVDISFSNMYHMIEERKNRFPTILKELSTNELASKICSALALGIKIQQSDHTYAKAIYSTCTHEISWLLPFYIDNDINKEPELVLVLREKNDFFELKTIMEYDDDLKDKVTSIYPYSKLW